MMKAHNRALDFVVLALSQGRKGNIERSAQLLSAALEEPDCVTAIKILEASNKQAMLAQAAAKRAAVEAAKKPAVAKKSVKADLDEGTDEVDDGLDDDEMMGLMDGGDAGEGAEVEASEDDAEGEDEDGDEGDDEEEEDAGDETFAKLLAAMRKKSAK